MLSGEGEGEGEASGSAGIVAEGMKEGLVTVIVPAEPLHAPPAASFTDRVGWKVPDA